MRIQYINMLNMEGLTLPKLFRVGTKGDSGDGTFLSTFD